MYVYTHVSENSSDILADIYMCVCVCVYQNYFPSSSWL